MDSQKNKLKMATLSVHGGEKQNAENALITPIFQSATFTFNNTNEITDFFDNGKKRQAEYGRYGNPTQTTVENKLAKLEGAENAKMFATGMNAITTTMLSLVEAGDHIILTNDCYRQTSRRVHAGDSRAR